MLTAQVGGQVASAQSTNNLTGTCEQLVEYRDTHLLVEYDRAFAKYKDRHKKLIKNLQLYQDLRNNELSDENLRKAQFMKLSDVLVVFPLQTLADLIKTFVPAASLAGLAEDSTKSAKKLLKIIELENDSDQIIKMFQEELEITVARLIFKHKGGYGSQVVTGLYDTTTNFIASGNRLNEWEDVVEQLRIQAIEVDKIIASIEENINKTKLPIEHVNYIKNSIDWYCDSKNQNDLNEDLSLESIANGIFVHRESSSVSGSAFSFKEGYADYCIWSDNAEDFSEFGIDGGVGLNKRTAKLNFKNNEIVFRPGHKVFSGHRYSIKREGHSFSFGSFGVYEQSGSWSSATFGRQECLRYSN